MKTKNYITRIFRYVRTQRKASYRGFASLLGVNASTILRYERGERRPSQKVLNRLIVLSGEPDLVSLVKRAYNIKE